MKRFGGYILDLDGTVYLGGRLIPGADETIAKLRRRSGLVFLSNNPSRNRESYARKLSALGIPCTPDDIVNSSYVITEVLKREAPDARLYVVGEASICAEMRAAGLKMAGSPEETDIVVLSFDRTFHYGKWAFAHRALRHGARLWATNPDRTCPTEDGDTPDCGALMAAVETASGRSVERMTGKPSAAILDVAAARLRLPLSDCLMVGDRLETDIQMACDAGCASALVLTGITSRAMLKDSAMRPDYVLESVTELATGGKPQ